MIPALYAIGLVFLLAATGSVIGRWLLRESSIGWGWSYLLGTAALGSFLYVPLAATGTINHSVFAAGLFICVGICTWNLSRYRAATHWIDAIRHSWLADLRFMARVVILTLMAAAACSTLYTRPTSFDARATFALKARLLHDTGTIRGPDFQDTDEMHFNAHYPLLAPLLEAELFWLQGSNDDRCLRFIFFGYVLALASIVAGELRRHCTPRVAAVSAALLLCIPSVNQAIEGAGLTSSVDMPLACYATAGALATMRWLRTNDSRAAILAGIMFGAAVLTKSEGTLWIAAAGVTLLTLLATRRVSLNLSAVRSVWAGSIVFVFLLSLHLLVRRQIPYSPYLRSYAAAFQWDWLRQLGARPWEVASYGLMDCLRTSMWNFTWPCVAAIMLLRRKQPLPNDVLFARVLSGIVAAMFFGIFVVTPYHVYWQLITALHRLVLQLLPLAWVLAVEQLVASGWLAQLQTTWLRTIGKPAPESSMLTTGSARRAA